LTEADRVEYEAERRYGSGTVTRSYEAERRALTWEAAVEGLLESYESDRGARLKFGKGRPGSSGREEFTVPVENSWMPAAQERAFAQLKALERETVGFYRCDESGCGYYCGDPDGHGAEWVAGEYRDPCLGLVTFSASATPDGDHLPPVDHTDARRETWGGRDGVRRKLRDVMGRKLGLESDDWAYWRQCEPHTGDGENACYGHDHVLVVFDRAAVEGDLPLDVAEGLLRRAVDRHVERCEYAGREAHGGGAVEVKSVEGGGDGEVSYLANYMASYLAVDPDQGLLERSIEYVAWAAQMWAANRNKRSRSTSAGDAIEADACRQRYRDPDAEQEHGHGERLTHAGGRGEAVVCAACGSSWGVSDGDTVVEARRGEGALAGSESAAGGGVGGGPEAALRGRWPSATAAAETATGEGVVGFDRPPDWRAESLVRGDGEDAEEHPLGRGSVDMVELSIPEDGDRSLWERPGGAVFRCSVCNFSTYETEVMKRHAGKHDAAPGEVVIHDFLSSRSEGGTE
jgi:hypothetical protein